MAVTISYIQHGDHRLENATIEQAREFVVTHSTDSTLAAQARDPQYDWPYDARRHGGFTMGEWSMILGRDEWPDFEGETIMIRIPGL